jgi:2,4-dienoyl-CoA reductase-like NADH-dependent reductase (Old Yellow Enzyme family)
MAVQLLFTPGHLGRLTVKNRLIMAPMVRKDADEQGCMTPRYLAHLERIARDCIQDQDTTCFAYAFKYATGDRPCTR